MRCGQGAGERRTSHACQRRRVCGNHLGRGTSWWSGAGGQPSGARCPPHPHHAKESEVLTQEEHATLLHSFAVDRLLQLVTLEAKRLHNGHVTIVALTTQYQVAFGPPTLSPGSAGGASAARAERLGSPTLKEALITALVEEKGGDDAGTGAPDA